MASPVVSQSCAPPIEPASWWDSVANFFTFESTLRESAKKDLDIVARCNKQEDYQTALMYSRSAADKGDVDSQFQVGRAYLYGRTQTKIENGQRVQTRVGEDRDLGLSYIEKAADNGHVEAMLTLGSIYLGELDFLKKKDYGEAFYYFEKLAERNNVNGIVKLGSMYEKGQYVSVDLAKAESLYQRAAELGSLDARVKLKALGEKSDKDLYAKLKLDGVPWEKRTEICVERSMKAGNRFLTDSRAVGQAAGAPSSGRDWRFEALKFDCKERTK